MLSIARVTDETCEELLGASKQCSSVVSRLSLASHASAFKRAYRVVASTVYAWIRDAKWSVLSPVGLFGSGEIGMSRKVE